MTKNITNTKCKMIKLYQPEDLEKLVKFTEEIKQNVDPQEWGKAYLDPLAYRNHWFKNPKFITHYSEKTIQGVNGFIIMRSRGPNTLELDMLYVTPFFRREGVATQLKEACVRWGDNQGYDFIVSKVGTSNKASIALNEKAGWGIIAQNYETILFYKRLRNDASPEQKKEVGKEYRGQSCPDV